MNEQVLKASNEAQNYERDEILAETRNKAEQLNSEIENMRKKGLDPNYIAEWREQKTEELALDHFNRAYATKKQVEAALDESIEKWQEERDKRPERSLLDFQRKQAEVDALDDDEIFEEARAYNIGEDKDYERLTLIARRLKQVDPAEYKTLKKEMKSRRASEPWLKDPRIGELERRRQVLDMQQFGKVYYRIGEREDQYQIADLHDFIAD
jgi:hypothetical protein